MKGYEGSKRGKGRGVDLDPTIAILFQISNRALKIKGDFFFFPKSITKQHWKYDSRYYYWFG